MPPKVRAGSTASVRVTSKASGSPKSSGSRKISSSSSSRNTTSSRPTTVSRPASSTVRSAPSKPASAPKPAVSHTTVSRPATSTVTKTATVAKTAPKPTPTSSKPTVSHATVSKPTTSTVTRTATVAKTTQAPPKPATAPKPNVDKVDFGKPKPQVDAGTYKQIVSPGSKFGYATVIRGSGGSSSEPPKSKKTEKAPSKAPKDLTYSGQYSEAFKKEAVPLRSFAEQQYNRKIEARAHAQIEAEKDAKTNETKQTVLKIKRDLPVVIVGAVLGGTGGAIAGMAVTKMHDLNEAKAHDEGKMTDVEETIYQENLYGRYSDKGFFERKADQKYDKEHEAEIDQVKAAIREEEEDENK